MNPLRLSTAESVAGIAILGALSLLVQDGIRDSSLGVKEKWPAQRLLRNLLLVSTLSLLGL